jgi:hypothetical protein
MSQSQLPDEVIRYQLDKVNQGGAVYELFEGRVQFLAEVWGYETTEDGDGIILPDGRIATLEYEVVIRDPD